MSRRLPAAVVACVLLLAACDSDRRAISRDDLPDLPDRPRYVVVLDDDGFDRDRLEVETTDLVQFRIEGEEPRGIQTDDRSIDTGLLLPGESTFVVFDQEKAYQVTDSADTGHVLEIDAVASDTAAS